MNVELRSFKHGEHNSESEHTIDRVIAPLEFPCTIGKILMISTLRQITRQRGFPYYGEFAKKKNERYVKHGFANLR